jgi:hypothetical protein
VGCALLDCIVVQLNVQAFASEYSGGNSDLRQHRMSTLSLQKSEETLSNGSAGMEAPQRQSQVQSYVVERRLTTSNILGRRFLEGHTRWIY